MSITEFRFENERLYNAVCIFDRPAAFFERLAIRMFQIGLRSVVLNPAIGGPPASMFSFQPN